MGYKDENLKHRMGIGGQPRYKCPHCKKGLNITKIPFMLICGKCKKCVKGEQIIINSKED